MDNNLFAESPCFENKSLTLEISLLCEEIVAFINIIKNELDFNNDSLNFIESVFTKYTIYHPKDWDCSSKLSNEVHIILEDIYKNTLKPTSFISVPKGRVSSYINLLRVKTRKLTRLFYTIEKIENIDTSFQKALFSKISAYFFYLSINLSK